MLPVGYILKEKYRILGHIASGGFGNTYLAVTLANNVKVAVKEFFMKNINAYDNNFNVLVSNRNNEEIFQKQMRKFFNEAQTQACITNAHVVHVTESFLLNQTAFYVMEYVDGHTLAQIIKANAAPLSVDRATDIFLQVIDALYAIHQKGILHLDIKPSNIMVDKMGVAKIIDFGTAKLFNEGTDTISTYTPAYAPMEVHQQRPDAIGQWTDIYSLGATFYYIITGKRPPQDTDIVDYGENAFRFPADVDSRTRNLIIWMMKPARKDRPQNVLQILKFLENGIIPGSHDEEEVTIVGDDNTSYATVYTKDGRNGMADRDGQDDDDDDDDSGAYRPKKKKSYAGCWIFLLLLALFAAVGYYLYANGMLDRFLTKGPVENVVEDDSLQEVTDSLYQQSLRQQQEIDYYDQLYALIDETGEKVKLATSAEELDSLSALFESDWTRLNRKFDGVELSEKHETTLVKLIDKLETQIKEKTTELQQDDLIDIISSVLTGEEDDTTMHEDSYTEDNDSVAEIGAEPETEEEYFGSDNVESPY